MISFTPQPTGGYTLTCDEHEASLLGELAGQMIALLRPLSSTSDSQLDVGAGLVEQHPFMNLGAGGSSTPHSDPALARLLPDAYREEADAESASDFRRFTEQGLVDRKVSNALVVMNTVTTMFLTEGEAQSWLRSLTDIRLTLAVRIGIDSEEDALEEEDFLRDVYHWLGFVSESLLAAIDREPDDLDH